MQVNDRDREIEKLQDEMKLISKRVQEIELLIRELESEKR